MRGLRTMRLVTLDALLQRVVDDGIDLGKARRPRRVVHVASGARVTPPIRRRLDVRILGVSFRRSVARLAREIVMVARALRRVRLVVAFGAGIRSRVMNRLGGFPLDGRLPLLLSGLQPAWDALPH